VLGEGVVWYSGQFWPLYYLGTVVKLDPLATAYIVGGGLIIGTPTLILFGWLSDHIGRKPVILAGFLLAALTYYPLFKWLGAVAQPGNVNYPVAILIVAIMVAYVGLVYGRRPGALHHYRGLRRDRQPCLRPDLSDRRSRDRVGAQPVPDAGNARAEHLGRDGAAEGVKARHHPQHRTYLRGRLGPAVF
jgi:hypothetical protein